MSSTLKIDKNYTLLTNELSDGNFAHENRRRFAMCPHISLLCSLLCQVCAGEGVKKKLLSCPRVTLAFRTRFS